MQADSATATSEQQGAGEGKPDDRPARSLHGRRSRASGIEIGTLTVVCAAAAWMAALADTAPTGSGGIDAVQRSAFAVALVLAASRAKRWTLALGAMLAAVASSGWGMAAGAAGLTCVAAMAFTGRRDRILGAAAGAFISVAALRLAVPGPYGMEAIVVAVVAIPILGSGYSLAPSRVRRGILLALAIVGAVALVLLAGGMAAGVLSVSNVASANDSLGAGSSATNDGDQAAAVASFAVAEENLRAADSKLGAWWAVGARAIPVAGANYRAAQDSVAAALSLADVGGTLASDVDLERIRRDEGGIDVDVLASFEEPLVRAAQQVDEAENTLSDLDSGLLVGPVRARLDEARDTLAELDDEVATAALGAEKGPAMLGADAPRRYLFLLGSPAELRDVGGHIGNWAEITLDDGQLELVEVGGPRDLELDEADAPEELAGFPASVTEMNPAAFPQNWGATPDVPTITQLTALLFEARTGRPLDGVLYADPVAFAQMLGLTGPLPVEGLGEPWDINEGNAVRFLTSDQYYSFLDDNAAAQAIEDLIRMMFEELEVLPLPGPRSVSADFSPVVRAGSLQMGSVHQVDEPLLQRLALQGWVNQPDGGDLLAVLNRNAGQNKIDTYLRRRTEADIEWDPTTGGVRTTVDVELANDAPAEGFTRTILGNSSGLPWGTNLTDLIVVSPHRNLETTIDGEPAATQPLREDSGLWRHRVRVTIPPGESRSVRFNLVGSVAAGPDYRLALVGQPLLEEGDVVVNIDSTEGALAGPGTDGSAGPAEIVMDIHADRVVEWRATER